MWEILANWRIVEPGDDTVGPGRRFIVDPVPIEFGSSICTVAMMYFGVQSESVTLNAVVIPVHRLRDGSCVSHAHTDTAEKRG